MLQFYFLSILLNMVTGFILVWADGDDANREFSVHMPQIVYDETFRFILGIFTAITGFFKLLTAIQGDVPVIGDLLPALVGLIGGFTLVYEYYRARSTADEDSLPVILQKIVCSKRYVGMACLGAAGLHFLFPNVLFL